MENQNTVGKPLSRLEGRLKVTGEAKYSGEYPANDLLYGYVLNSTITKGEIIKIDASEALKLAGVQILTHENRPKLPWFDLLYADLDAPPGKVFKPLYNEEILYNGQPIALILAPI